MARNRRIRERRVSLVYNCPGAIKRDLQRVDVDFVYVEQAVVFSKILDSEFHVPVAVAYG